ncbi:MAG: magnesium transporter [Bacteroidetes bacterium]|nr:magnesium transporter [Bacteroidota bacterium]
MVDHLEIKEQFRKWQKLLKKKEEAKLVNLLQEATIVDIADFISIQPKRTILRLLSLFVGETRASIFAHFDEPLQSDLYKSLPKPAIADMFLKMASDQRADIYKKLSDNEQIKLLPYLKKRVREDVITLSSYPPESAGSVMNTDFVTVQYDVNVGDCLNRLREDAPSKKMMYYLYVLNEDLKLVGIVSLKDILMAAPLSKIKDLIIENFIYCKVNDTRESVAHKIEKYDLAALPILNEDNQIIGVVSHDDAMDIIRKEETEDMEKFMGIISQKDQNIDYLTTSSFQHFKKRIGWIIGLFILSFLSGAIIQKFENVIMKFTILATYITSITDAGGNAGSQAATVVIRAISLGQITLKNWLKIIFKEAKVAILLSLCLFILSFIKVTLLSHGRHTNDYDITKIAFVIATALSIQVIVSTLIGAILPLIAKLFKGDPAVAASPAITTLVDITGMIIYFYIAATML